MTTSDGKSPRIFGIDLGTTYSCISYINDRGTPVLPPTDRQSFLTPSVVYYESDDQVIVGEDAKQEMKRNPDYGVEQVKRHLGQQSWSVNIHDKERTAIEITAFIFKKLAR